MWQKRQDWCVDYSSFLPVLSNMLSEQRPLDDKTLKKPIQVSQVGKFANVSQNKSPSFHVNITNVF